MFDTFTKNAHGITQRPTIFILNVPGFSVLFPITEICRLLFILYLIDTPFNTFANIVDLDQIALIRAA